MTLRRLIVALLVVTAGLGTGLTAGASAAVAAGGYCSGAGVNVVVDFTGQGGGIDRGCAVHGGGGNAWDAFQAAGFALTGVQRYPGAVCRVSGRPADASCQGMPPADAYWGFFTSHGGGWSYASVGPTSYRVVDGDTVAFAWQTGAHRAPGAAPATPHASTAAHPTATPAAPTRSHHGVGTHAGGSAPVPGHGPSHTAAVTPTAAPSASAPASASASRRPARRHHVTAPAAGSSASPTGTPSPTATADLTAHADAASTEPVAATPTATQDGGVPWWVPVLVLVVLAGAGTAFAWRRRTALR